MIRRWPLCLAACLAGCASQAPRPAEPPAPPAASSAARAVEAPPPRDDGRLSLDVVPRAYTLRLAIDPARDGFSGEVAIDIDVARPVSHVVLHGRSQTISRATVGGLGAVATARRAAGTKGDPDELVLALDGVLPAGKHTLAIAFDAPWGKDLSGVYRVDAGGDAYVFSQFEPLDARRAFPCFDEPGFKVPFTVTLDVPRGLVAVANTREVGRDELPGGVTRVRFAKSEPLPTYLVALAVGPLSILEGPRGTRLVATKGRAKDGKLALETAATLLAALEKITGVPYPYDKLDLVAVPDFGAGAMENPGLVTFREELLLLDERTVTTSERRALFGVLSHELAHQWFGNLVTARWWDDLWLNEGFATYAEARATDLAFPKVQATRESVIDKLSVMHLDVLPSARAIRQPVRTPSDAMEAFDGVTYLKGAALLSMLEAKTGEGAFRDGVRAYLAAHKHGNATSDDLYRALSTAAGEDVAKIAHTFSDQPGVPLVSFSLSCAAGRGTLTLAQSSLRARSDAEPKPRTWSVPVCFRAAGAKEKQCTTLSTATADVALDTCPAYVVPNVDERGYYRSNLSRSLRTGLVEKGFATLSDGEKIGLLSSTYALFAAGEVERDVVVASLRAFKRPHDQLQAESIAEVLRKLAEDAGAPEAAAVAREVMGPVVDALGFPPDALTKRRCPRCDTSTTDDAGLARIAALEAMVVVARDPKVTAEALMRAKKYLAKSPDVSPEAGKLCLRLAAHGGDRALFDDIMRFTKAAEQASDRTAGLMALASFEDPKLLREALDFALTDAVRAQDIRYVLRAAFRRSNERVTFEWAEARWSDLMRRLPEGGKDQLAGLLASTCDVDETARRLKFLEKGLAGVEGVAREMALGEERTRACADVRRRTTRDRRE